MRLLIALALCLLASPSLAFGYGGKTDKDDPCLPFKHDSYDEVLNSDKLVLAHFFNRFPLNIGDGTSYNDYYQRHYLSPLGENKKYFANGGYLRARPVYVQKEGDGYDIKNLEKEIRLAISRGINGITFNILGLSDLDDGSKLPDFLAAKENVDSRFKVVLMPDVTSMSGGIEDFKTVARNYFNDTRVYHLSDGRIVLSPYHAESFTPEQWQAALGELETEGVHVAFWPTFLSVSQPLADSYAPFSYGVGWFATPRPDADVANVTIVGRIKNAGMKAMAGIAPQGYRPKSYIFWETQGSLGYTKGWEGTISSDADAVQLTTWNDFSETTQVLPYIGKDRERGFGYYNLTAYYSHWFRNGSPPPITHDVVYYFHRKEPYNAANPLSGSATAPQVWSAYNIIEALAFLKEPAELRITTASTNSIQAVKGITRYTVPLEAVRPSFSVIRDGQTVINFESDITPVGMEGLQSGYLDLTYWTNSASKDGICNVEALR